MKKIILLLFLFLVNKEQLILAAKFDLISSDTICNFVIDKESNVIFLKDSSLIKSDQKIFAIIQLTTDEDGFLKKWDLNLFRIMEKDKIVLNYSRFIDSCLPQGLINYCFLIDDYVKRLKIKRLNTNQVKEPCNILIKIFFTL